jgi:hypothetical protein
MKNIDTANGFLTADTDSKLINTRDKYVNFNSSLEDEATPKKTDILKLKSFSNTHTKNG